MNENSKSQDTSKMKAVMYIENRKLKKKFIILSFTFFIGLSIGILAKDLLIKFTSQVPYIQFDDVRKTKWEKDFKIIEITASIDGKIQKAYSYKASSQNKPLIVSLHSWSADYTQKDILASLCKQNDINYIHPDFRGPNSTVDACGSEAVISDIDDAITYAKTNFSVDTNSIFVVGTSGGGFAALLTFAKSKHNIKKISVWVPITDLVAWYHESSVRGNKYAQDIIKCTENEKSAKDRSPIYQNTPVNKLDFTELAIYAGVFDGIQGSVPITHSINYYNKVLNDLGVEDPSLYISDMEKLKLLEFRQPLGDYGKLSDRKIYLEKKYKNLSLKIFEGNHEMLPEYAFNQLIRF